MKVDTYLFAYLWHHYQGLDWCLLIVLAIVMACVTTLVKPHCRSFQWTDASIGYPMKDDTFPNWSIALFIILPLVIFVLGTLFVVPWLQKHLPEPLSLLSSRRFTRRPQSTVLTEDSTEVDASRAYGRDAIYGYDTRQMGAGRGSLYAWIRAHAWATITQLFIMALVKSYAGRLRPDYIDRLRKANYTAADPSLPDPMTNPSFYCHLMDDHPDLKEGRFSFPSGHSSSSFAACTMVCLYLLTHLRPLARQGSFVRLCISLCPLWPAFACAVSRTRDNKHNFSDILAGTILGVVCALVCFTVCFREVGGLAGALNIYVAREENDMEYVQWQRQPLSTRYELRPRETQVSETFSAASPKGTTAVEVDERTQQEAELDTQARAGPFSPLLSEKQMNQNSDTVPWL